MKKLHVENLRFSYGDAPVLDGIDFDVDEGELVAVLGSSGCGKTTLLRAIAGLISVQDGIIAIDGKQMQTAAARDRNAAMVFQQYALFPHMDVAGNVGYGLGIRGVTGVERAARVAAILELVGLAGYERRAVNTLSGGQQQRVAIGRALAIKPDILLLDEPLSSLDEHLRARMRKEIRSMVKTAGVTALYVTHDQDEAMEMADRIIVLRAGRVEQIATPQELSDAPASEYVARFLGYRTILPGLLYGGILFLPRLGDVGPVSPDDGAVGGDGADIDTDGVPVRVLIPEHAVRIVSVAREPALSPDAPVGTEPEAGTEPAHGTGVYPGISMKVDADATSLTLVRGAGSFIHCGAHIVTVERRSGIVRVLLDAGGTELVALLIYRPESIELRAGDRALLEIDRLSLRIVR